MSFHTAVGDILLVTGSAKSSKGLVAGQKAIIYDKAVSSHAAFSLTDGSFIHSTTDKGVHLAFFPDIIQDCEDGWRVIRLKELDEEKRRLLLAGANHFLSQDYNYGLLGKGSDSSSFCSELAAKAYQRAGVHILNGLQPSKVAPAHFDIEADLQKDWTDVTEDYRKLLEDIKANPEIYALGFMVLAHSIERLRRTNVRTEIMMQIAKSLFKSDNFQAEIQRAKKELDEQKLFSFWNVKGESQPDETEGK